MVTLFVEDVDFDPSPLADIDTWLSDVARSEESSILELTYVFGSDEYLLNINRQFLNHDYYTDVITFDHQDVSNSGVEGDVFISVDRVSENAVSLSEPFLKELRRVMVHALLHLLGYNDDNDESKQAMRGLEDKYLLWYPSTQQGNERST